MNDSKYFSTEWVSRELNLELSRLKKIAYLIEKVLELKNYYHRNSKNQRMYTSEQIMEIEDIIVTKKKNKVSYSVAVYMEFNSLGNDISKKITNEKDMYQWFENMERCMFEQKKSIEKIAISIENLLDLENQNHKRMKQMDKEIAEILKCVQLSRVDKKNRLKKWN